MLKGFTAIAIGGLTTVGSVMAGLLLGIMEAYTVGLISSEFADAIVFSVLILVLLGRSYAYWEELRMVECESEKNLGWLSFCFLSLCSL